MKRQLLRGHIQGSQTSYICPRINKKQNKLGCGPMPNVMVALPSVQRCKVWLTPTTGVPCSNAAKTRNPLKLTGMPKLPDPSQPLVGRSSPYGGASGGDIAAMLLDKFLQRAQCSHCKRCIATAIPSVCPSVCHTPILCQNDGT